MGNKFIWIIMAICLLMLLHVGLIYVDLFFCARLFEAQMQELGAGGVDLSKTECHTIEETLQAAVSEYLKVFLALLGGGAAVEIYQQAKKDK